MPEPGTPPGRDAPCAAMRGRAHGRRHQLAGQDGSAQPPAGDDEVGQRERAPQAGPVDGAHAVPGGEVPGAVGAGVDLDIVNPAVAQSGDGGTGVGARADDERAHALRRQVPRGDLQADGDDAAPGAGQRGPGGHVPRGGRGVLDDAGQGAGDGALGGGEDQGAAELAGDLALADDHRLQASRSGEELVVRGPARPEAQAHGPIGSRSLGEEGGHVVAQGLGRQIVGGVQEDRQTVAGAQDEGAVEAPDGAEQVGPEAGGDASQAGDCRQALSAMIGGEKMNSHSERQSSTRRRRDST